MVFVGDSDCRTSTSGFLKPFLVEWASASRLLRDFANRDLHRMSP